jgi:hypothetical protein
LSLRALLGRFLRGSQAAATRSEAPPAAEPSNVASGPESGSANGWRALGCSVTGTYHLDARRPCEDVSTVVEIEGGFVLAVADGAGSAPCALQGATLAVGGSTRSVVQRLLGGKVPVDAEGWDQLLMAAVGSGRRALEGADRPLRDLACTLLLAVLHEDTLAAVQVGDGWVVAEDRDGGVRAVTVPGKGEYFNETLFLTSESYLEGCTRSVETAAGVTGVAVLSDGLEMVACDLRLGQPYPGFFEPLFRFVREPHPSTDEKRRELSRFLDSEGVNRRTHDDKSLVIVAREDTSRARVGTQGSGVSDGSEG